MENATNLPAMRSKIRTFRKMIGSEKSYFKEKQESHTTKYISTMCNKMLTKIDNYFGDYAFDSVNEPTVYLKLTSKRSSVFIQQKTEANVNTQRFRFTAECRVRTYSCTRLYKRTTFTEAINLKRSPANRRTPESDTANQP